jgi:hypothetical protein
MKPFLDLLPVVPEFDCRPVEPRLIEALSARGCSSEEWNRVLFSGGTDLSLVSNTVFRGEVRVHLPGGLLRDTVLENAVIEGPAVIQGNSLVKGLTILADSILENNGVLLWDAAPSALKREMFLGEETGFRRVPILPTLDHGEAFRLAAGEGRGEALQIPGLSGTIGPGTVVRYAPLVENSLLLANTRLDCPGPIRGSILLPGASVKNGAQVHNSVLQWRALADTMALVLESIVGEGSVVKNHGKLSRSFLGADSVLGEGEMTTSLAGPFTGMHHQSLLIAALWPGGKGNVGYGANAGSNHTSRLPDQELRLGDGVFIGLGASVKFPADYTGSPFTVIATGVMTLPQKVCFPFSLISQPHHRPSGVPDGFNRLSPGWMLTDNLYALARNAWKFHSRSTAVHTRVNTSLLTDRILGMTRNALERLKGNLCSNMPGLGKNFMTEEDREKGAAAYEALLEAEELYRRLLRGGLDRSGSRKLSVHISRLEEGVRASRAKDHDRGREIIEDYAAVRPSPEKEPFLDEFTEYLEDLRRRLDGVSG